MKSKVLLFCTLCLFLSGCNEIKKDRNKPDEPTIITWWHINSDEPTQRLFEQIAEDFSSAHKGVKVRVTALNNVEFNSKLTLEFAAENPPDIFHSWGGGTMIEQVEAGYLKDITEWYEDDSWESKINPAALDIYSYKGKIYGFPHDMGAVGFWYNTEILEQAGYDKFPTEWDDFIVLLDELKQAGIIPLSLGIADQWPVMYYWVYLTMRIGGSDIYSKIKKNERSFSDPAMIQAGEIMQNLYKSGYFSKSSLGDDFISQSRLMGDGLSAMQLMGQWALAIQTQTADNGDKLVPIMKFAPFPEIEGYPGSINDIMGGGNGFVVGKNAPDEAIDLLKYFSTMEVQQEYFDVFPAVPTVPGVKINAPGMQMVQEYVQGAENYSLYPDQMFPKEVGSLINEISARVLLGEFSSERGCEILQQAWENYQK